MSYSKVNELLFAMSPTEVEGFITFLLKENPSLCHPELVRALSKDLIPKQQYQVCYQAHVNAANYSYKTWRYLLSDIFTSLKKYLAFKELSRNDELEEWLYLCHIRRLNLNEVHHKERRRISSKLNKNESFSLRREFTQLLLAEETYDLMSAQKREAPKYLDQLNHALNSFFLSKKLHIYCAAESHKSISNFELEDSMSLNFEAHIKDSSRVHKAYFMALETLRGNQALEMFIDHLKMHSSELSKLELRDLYLMAINRCIRIYNQGKTEFLNKVFDLYKMGLDQGLFVEDGRMSRFTYRNITSAAVGLKAYDWAQNFLETYKGFLPKKDREDQFRYHKALLSVAQKDFNTAIELLRDSRFKDPLMILDARRMLIKVYYETDEWDALNYLLDSFWSYLYRHKELGYHRKNYLNMVKYLKKILYIQHKDDVVKEKWKRKIEDSENVAEKNWLLSLL